MRIETPPTLSGQPEQKIAQLNRYLFRMAEMLNVALDTIGSASQTSAAMVPSVGTSAANSGKSVMPSEEYEELKALIINTAGIVNKTVDTISTELSSQYTAISEDWGTFQKNIGSTITATAEGVVQQYNYSASIETLQEAAAGFSDYMVEAEGYIRQGFIGYDEKNVPIIGIAVGQNLSAHTVTIDGEEYVDINSTPSCALYTAEKVSFIVSGLEVAYVSNSKLYIRDVEITGKATLGKWEITTNNGFTIKWIGG